MVVKRKILIIGAKGMLGQALVTEFRRGHKVLAWDKDEIDITDAEAVSSKLKAAKPDIIINAAAYTDVDGCEEKPELAMKVNAEGVKNLAAEAREIGVTLIQYSTEYVFDGKNEAGYKEDAKPVPLSVYGSSKLAGELAAAQAEKFYIIRLSRLFGKPGGGKQSFVDKILEKASSLSHVGEGNSEVRNMGSQKEKKITQAEFPTSPQPSPSSERGIKVIDEETSCPTYAPDLARFTRKLLESKALYGIYHGANSGKCTWYGMAREIFKIAGNGVELVPVTASTFSRKAQRPKFAELINTKLPSQRAWQEALKEYFLNSKSIFNERYYFGRGERH